MPKPQGLRERVLDQIHRFRKEHGKTPTRVHLSRSDEDRIRRADIDDVGLEVASLVFAKGPRGVSRFLGLEVEWDADETRVD